MSEDFEDIPDSIAIRKDKKLQEQMKQTDLLGQLLSHIDNDNNYIPWERVILPSQGIYYGDKMPGGVLEVKPMGVDVDKMLSNQRLIQSGELISKIVESCARLPDGFSIREMLSGDFNYLIYYLRGITHGTDYEFISECPFCGSKNTFEFDLTELHKSVKGPSQDWPEEPMEVELPKLSSSFGKKIYALIRLVRVDDIMKMTKPGNDGIYDPIKRGRARVKSKDDKIKSSKNNQIDPSKLYEDNMKLQVIGFKCEEKVSKNDDRIALLNKLHQSDSSAINKFIEDISPGINMTIEVTCADDECGKDYSTSIPWSEDFFRPSK